MVEEATCTEPLHRELVRDAVALLNGPAFGNGAIRARARLAKVLARMGEFDVAGEIEDGDDIEPSEKLLRTIHPPVPARGEPAATERLKDFRTKAQREADSVLRGCVWRCPDHGLTEDPIVLCHAEYCPFDGCTKRVLLVASPAKEKGR